MRTIKWRFVVIYFLLVLAVLVIVASSITGRLESSLISDKLTNVENQINSLVHSSGYFSGETLDENVRGIRASISERRFQNDEDIFVIGSEDFETILASKTNSLKSYDGVYAYNAEELNLTLIDNAYKGETGSITVTKDTGREVHLAVPVGEGHPFKGVVYAILNLNNIESTLTRAKRIMLDSGFVALFITVVLSYMIAGGITNPISRVTEVAKKMSEGDFDQHVDVKSNDEIGRLCEMFNLLTRELKTNINRTELERAKLNIIFNQMVEAVVAIDVNNKIIHINDRAKELFNIGKDVEPGNITLTPEQTGLSTVNFANPYTLEGEGALNRDNKSYRLIYAPFEDKNLMVGGIIVIYQDMTKERKLEDMRREFVANVSHELKTPITSIKSYVETLMKYPVDEETQKHFLSVIDNESDRMAHIVRDLLTLTTLEYRGEDIKPESCDFNEIVKSAVERLRMSAKDKTQSIHEYYADNVVGDANKEDLLQVVINLISNAIKYTPDGGIIKVSTFTENDYNYITVEDNGYGIAPKDRARIFERFYRVEKSRSRQLGGTGLGLAIAKEMTEKMKGEISVSSELNKGSKFILRFRCGHEGEI